MFTEQGEEIRNGKFVLNKFFPSYCLPQKLHIKRVFCFACLSGRLTVNILSESSTVLGIVFSGPSILGFSNDGNKS